MARFRLSTDILSPLNSDISLNDGSIFSFGSLPGTPIFDKNITSPICSAQDTVISPFCMKTMKESADIFDEVTDDIKKQSSINSEKEEKYKETFEMLKKSMDDLFQCNDTNSPVFSPQSINSESKNENLESKVHSKRNTVEKFQDSKTHKKITCPDPVNSSETTAETKCEKSTSRPKKLKSKNTSSESIKDTKNKCEARIKNYAHGSDERKSDQKKNSKITPKNDAASFGDKATSSKISCVKNKEKGTESLKKYDYKCQKKIPVSNSMPIIEHKSLAIEKRIQLAVSLEMDNVRKFVLEQNLYMRKDILKLQEMAMKQNEVRKYLFSVIDELLDTNKKLISRYN